MTVDVVGYPKLWWQFNTCDIAEGDGVDMSDFAILVKNWLTTDSDIGWDAAADFDLNGQVDVADLVLFSENWLAGL